MQRWRKVTLPLTEDERNKPEATERELCSCPHPLGVAEPVYRVPVKCSFKLKVLLTYWTPKLEFQRQQTKYYLWRIGVKIPRRILPLTWLVLHTHPGSKDLAFHPSFLTISPSNWCGFSGGRLTASGVPVRNHVCWYLRLFQLFPRPGVAKEVSSSLPPCALVHSAGEGLWA